MLKLDTDMVVTTVPDLQSYHMKRSILRDDIEYIYVFHAPVSTIMQYKESAFDYFDTVLCVGPHHVAELRRREELAKLPARKLVKAGYGLYDQLLENYGALRNDDKEKPRVLIAPSWQNENILETCINDLLDVLLGNGYEVIVRPHPQFGNLFPERLEALVQQYAAFSVTGELVFELDFSSNNSIYTSDILVTDWSGIAYEFSYCTSRPCIFINTPQKIMNANYLNYGIEPMEISIRNKVGISINPERIIEELRDSIESLLHNDHTHGQQVKETLLQYLYYPNRSGEAGGRYIIESIERRMKNDLGSEKNK